MESHEARERAVRTEMMGAAPIVEHVVPRAEVYEYGLPPVVAHDITRWGPIFAGFFSSISVIVLLGILGAAVGLRFAGTNASADVGWGPYIWGAVMLIVGFFCRRLGNWAVSRGCRRYLRVDARLCGMGAHYYRIGCLGGFRPGQHSRYAAWPDRPDDAPPRHGDSYP